MPSEEERRSLEDKIRKQAQDLGFSAEVLTTSEVENLLGAALKTVPQAIFECIEEITLDAFRSANENLKAGEVYQVVLVVVRPSEQYEEGVSVSIAAKPDHGGAVAKALALAAHAANERAREEAADDAAQVSGNDELLGDNPYLRAVRVVKTDPAA